METTPQPARKINFLLLFARFREVGIIGFILLMAVIVSLPMLLAGLVVGVLVSIFQTVTSIQDNILAFIPRAAVIFVVFALTFPWMLRVVSGFSRHLIQRLPELIR